MFVVAKGATMLSRLVSKVKLQHVGAVRLLAPQVNRCQLPFDSLDLVQVKKKIYIKIL